MKLKGKQYELHNNISCNMFHNHSYNTVNDYVKQNINTQKDGSMSMKTSVLIIVSLFGLVLAAYLYYGGVTNLQVMQAVGLMCLPYYIIVVYLMKNED